MAKESGALQSFVLNPLLTGVASHQLVFESVAGTHECVYAALGATTQALGVLFTAVAAFNDLLVLVASTGTLYLYYRGSLDAPSSLIDPSSSSTSASLTPWKLLRLIALKELSEAPSHIAVSPPAPGSGTAQYVAVASRCRIVVVELGQDKCAAVISEHQLPI